MAKKTVESKSVHTYKLPPEVLELCTLLATHLKIQNQPTVFCGRCRKEVPDRMPFCYDCWKKLETDKQMSEMRQRIHALITPHVKTIGGMVKVGRPEDSGKKYI